MVCDVDSWLAGSELNRELTVFFAAQLFSLAAAAGGAAMITIATNNTIHSSIVSRGLKYKCSRIGFINTTVYDECCEGD